METLDQRHSRIARALGQLDEDSVEQAGEAARIIQDLPEPLSSPSQVLLALLAASARKRVWLSDGPDSYETIDDTINSSKESRYTFDPYVIWELDIFNNASAGGANLLVRLTDEHGRTKQYKIPPQQSAPSSLHDIKGKLGSVFNIVTDSGSAEMIAFVLLRTPFGKVPE